MKKTKIILGALFALCMASCTNKGVNADNDEALKTDTVVFKQDNKEISVNIKAEFPIKGNQLLTNSIAEYISEQLGGTYMGTLSNGDSIVNYYGTIQQDSIKRTRQEFGETNSIQYTYNCEIKKEVETKQFVTYTTYSDVFLGGAHGSHFLQGATFRKSDGRKFGFDMLRNTDSEAFHALIKEGLMDYFNQQGTEHITTDAQLKEMLMTDNDVNYLPLPVTAPYLTEQGVTFIYQSYEIACYAAGMPTFTIPYDKIKPFLTSTVLQMVNNK